MSGDPKHKGPSPSRRDLLRGAGVAGAVAAAGVGAAQAQTAPAPAAPPRREALETLSASEADVLEAVCARLIPSDEHGPGAAEARAAHYIDRALGGALNASREAYRSGLPAIDAHARATQGGPFARLAPGAQDAVITELEANRIPGFPAGGGAFFALLRTHTLQGTFGDPYYGGNANFVGWDLLSYPGVRLAATPAQELMEPHLQRVHASAYDFAMFNRANAAVAMESHVPPGPLPDGMADMTHEH